MTKPTQYETQAIDQIVADGKLQKDIDKQDWTKEPWRLIGSDVFGGGNWVAITPLEANGQANETNARRIVACVNALAGIAEPAAFVAEANQALLTQAEFDKYAQEQGMSKQLIECWRKDMARWKLLEEQNKAMREVLKDLLREPLECAHDGNGHTQRPIFRTTFARVEAARQALLVLIPTSLRQR